MRPNLLFSQKLEFGSSFSLVLVASNLHLVSMRGPTETSTAFNSSMFEELKNLSLIEPSNSFKNSNFFSVLGAILDSWSEIDSLSDVGFVVFSACSSFLLFSCPVLLLYSSVPSDDSQNLLAINKSNEIHRGTNKPKQSYQYLEET